MLGRTQRYDDTWILYSYRAGGAEHLCCYLTPCDELHRAFSGAAPAWYDSFRGGFEVVFAPDSPTLHRTIDERFANLNGQARHVASARGPVRSVEDTEGWDQARDARQAELVAEAKVLLQQARMYRAVRAPCSGRDPARGIDRLCSWTFRHSYDWFLHRCGLDGGGEEVLRRAKTRKRLGPVPVEAPRARKRRVSVEGVVRVPCWDAHPETLDHYLFASFHRMGPVSLYRVDRKGRGLKLLGGWMVGDDEVADLRVDAGAGHLYWAQRGVVGIGFNPVHICREGMEAIGMLGKWT